MTVLLIMRGLPASGKTTAALGWVQQDLANRQRVNRDDIRQMLHCGLYVHGETEKAVIRVRDRLIDEALCSGASVVVDDCNLRSRHISELTKIGRRCGATVEIHDLTNVTPEECTRRNLKRKEARQRAVPDDVIWDMWERFVKGKSCPLPVPEVKEPTAGERVRYIAPDPEDERFKPAVIFDIDGTIAHMNGRSPYDYSLVSTDTADPTVVDTVWLYHEAGYRIIFLSGRKQECYHVTQEWLTQILDDPCVPAPAVAFDLLMRKDGDNRDDAQVKYELFDTYVRNRYAVHAVYDDRDRVVDMWRSIGLKTFQPERGNF